MVPVGIVLGIVPEIKARLGRLNQVSEFIAGWSENDNLDGRSRRDWHCDFQLAGRSNVGCELVCRLVHTSHLSSADGDEPRENCAELPANRQRQLDFLAFAEDGDGNALAGFLFVERVAEEVGFSLQVGAAVELD